MPSFSGANNIPLPKFSGAANQFSDERKPQILPLLLTGHANLWLSSWPLLTGTSFDTLKIKLKESLLVPESQPVNCTDEILQTLAKMKTSGNNPEPTVAAYNAPYNSSNSQGPEYKRENPLGKEEIAKLYLDSLGKKNAEPAMNKLTVRITEIAVVFTDGRPICNYCRNVGQFACRKRRLTIETHVFLSKRDHEIKTRGPGKNGVVSFPLVTRI